jgi:hypothetical protein
VSVFSADEGSAFIGRMKGSLFSDEEGVMRWPAVMRLTACAVASLFVSFLAAGCAKTISGSSATTTENGKYFIAGSEKQQQAYFEKVKEHFQQIGRPINDDEVKQFTASIFIISVPAAADVYDDTTFMGKTNSGQLYFTPGKHRVVLRKGDQQKSKVLDFAEGKNLSIVVKL